MRFLYLFDFMLLIQDLFISIKASTGVWTVSDTTRESL